MERKKMHPILKNLIAIIAGILTGTGVCEYFLFFDHYIIPLPDGVYVSSYKEIQAAMPFYEPKNFIIPYFSHLLGCLSGCMVTALLAYKHKQKLAILISFWFLSMALLEATKLPEPKWFMVLDLTTAYIPWGLYTAWWVIKKINPLND